ncbi:MAG: GAF domain-containing protein [Vicinamibacterales bacterium]
MAGSHNEVRLVKDYGAVLERVTTAIHDAADGRRATAAAVGVLKREVPDYAWVGIYLLEGHELVLGPFVGKPSPHTRIPLGRGICGAAATEKTTIIVDDVNADPRYLACSLETKSEIVVPIMLGDEVLGEIDIDSDRHAAFNADDQALLEAVAGQLAQRMKEPR